MKTTRKDIARRAGVSVSTVGMILGGRGQRYSVDTQQRVLDAAVELDEQWRSSAEQEKATRARFAQGRIRPDEVQAAVDAARHSLGEPGDVPAFTRTVLAELGAPDLDITAPVGLQPIVVQQLVVIARSLVVEAPVLVLDEPTAALGHAERQALFGVLRGRRDRGVAVILVSHRMDEVLQLSDEVVVLANGHLVGIVQRGDFDEQRLLEMMVA